MNESNKKQYIKNARLEAERKRWEGIRLYPSVEDVLNDPSLGCVFRPVLTTQKELCGKTFDLHAMVCLGTVFREDHLCKYSENGFFGFQYNQGKYIYLGSKEAFQWEYSKLHKIFEILTEDFKDHNENYLAQKLDSEAYQLKVMDKISPYVHDEDLESVTQYLHNFYSYELVKYQYQQTGAFKTYNELTKGWGSDHNFFHSAEDVESIVEEFFVNIEYNVSHDYDIDIAMACFGMDAFDFMANKCMLFALVDSVNDRVYLLEYYS